MNIIIAGKCLWKYQNELNKTLKEISITYHDILFGNTTCLIVLNGNLPVTIQTLSLGKMTLKLRASTLISTVLFYCDLTSVVLHFHVRININK